MPTTLSLEARRRAVRACCEAVVPGTAPCRVSRSRRRPGLTESWGRTNHIAQSAPGRSSHGPAIKPEIYPSGAIYVRACQRKSQSDSSVRSLCANKAISDSPSLAGFEVGAGIGLEDLAVWQVCIEPRIGKPCHLVNREADIRSRRQREASPTRIDFRLAV